MNGKNTTQVSDEQLIDLCRHKACPPAARILWNPVRQGFGRSGNPRVRSEVGAGM